MSRKAQSWFVLQEKIQLSGLWVSLRETTWLDLISSHSSRLIACVTTRCNTLDRSLTQSASPSASIAVGEHHAKSALTDVFCNVITPH
ncbi:hypothetical protein KIN20_024558 [Parelaphostrongylus tenuis]|uniref:Uncharacterized protein n=1 Tax=Parelaphostrongylus tenuis TaxID=148309 RepID=A0AAD5MYF5_PARTN|nr:hypothetical protein KIN20_024558 [Parelaphostrongylus tenuis]